MAYLAYLWKIAGQHKEGSCEGLGPAKHHGSLNGRVGYTAETLQDCSRDGSSRSIGTGPAHTSAQASKDKIAASGTLHCREKP